MKRSTFIKWLILMIVFAIAGPVIINEAYKFGKGYVTMWATEDTLSYYGAVLSFIGTGTLGLIAIKQTQQANDLTNKMLELEKSREIPIIDITEIKDDEQVTTDKLRSSLQVCLNDSYFYISDKGSISEGSCSVAVFRLVNICPNHIISLVIRDISQVTTYNNGESVTTQIKHIRYNGGIRVLGCNESQYLLIGGAYFEYPPSLTEQELYDKNYVDPVIELTISFLLGNIKGKKYCETIKICYPYACMFNIDDVNYPCILKKEILGIDEASTE